MKLDAITMFEWYQHSHEYIDVPHYQILLDFLNLHAQAAEASSNKKKSCSWTQQNKQATSFDSNATPTDSICVSCKSEKRSLYSCSKFRSLSHADRVDLLKLNNHSLNCLCPGHFVKKYKSLNHCKHCQRPHYTLLHVDEGVTRSISNATSTLTWSSPTVTPVNHVTISSNMLLMTCQVMVKTPQGAVNA